MAGNSDAASQDILKSYFARFGMLLCNDNHLLPSLSSVGGDWNGIVSLIEQGNVFYSKLFNGRVTYLSREFYAQVKPYRQRFRKVSPTSKRIFTFLNEYGPANTAKIKSALMLSSKEFSEGMDGLFKELLITALERDRTMNINWSSFYYGTYEAWEDRHPISDVSVSPDEFKRLVTGLLTDKQADKLLK